MRNKVLTDLTFGRLGLILIIVLIAVVPPAILADEESATQLNLPGNKATALLESTVIEEVWRSGFTIEGPVSYDAVIGRLLGDAVFRSFRETDIYYVFSAPATVTSVKSAQLRIDSKIGDYPGNTALSLEIHSDMDDSYRTISSGNIEWQSAISGGWIDIELDPIVDHKINPGEFLTFHMNFGDGAGGTLDLRPKFQVTVQSSVPVMDEGQLAEIWRSGYTVEGSPVYDEVLNQSVRTGFSAAGTPTYQTTTGRRSGVVGAFRSNRNASDLYYLFPISTSVSTVQSIKFYILSRAGTYQAGHVNLAFGIYNNDGLKHTLDSQIDLRLAEIDQWLTVTDIAKETMLPGDFLAAKVTFEAGSAGNLDLRIQFQADVSRMPNQKQYLPFID